MSTKIAFVNPPYQRIAPGYEFVKHATNQSPSLGLLHLAAQVRGAGYEPTIIESDVQGLDADAVVRRVVETRPRYVGITLFTVGVWSSAKIARGIQAALPSTTIIVGGPHVSSMGRETLERFPEFDLAVVGEGERTLVQVLECLDGGGDPAAIQGVIYRDGEGTPVETPPGAVQLDLDSLPFPAWDLLEDFPRAYLPAIYDFPAGPVATIAASRGCPFHCKFCDTSTFGASIRRYSSRAVFDMMSHLRKVYGVRHIMFVDDLFLASRSRVTELCELLLERGLKMSWTCTARVDTVRPEVLELMRRAGCWEISFGLETGSDELLEKMDKMARVAKSEQALKWSAEAGIRTKGLFMLGYPGETMETIEMTKAFVRRIPMDIMNLSKFTPYPGSPIYVDLYGTKIRPEHWERMNGMNFVWSPEGISIETLDREYQALLRSFYKQPRVLWYYVKISLRHPHHLLRLARLMMGYLGAKTRSLLRGNRGLLAGPSETRLD